jgi:hypothetical protein
LADAVLKVEQGAVLGAQSLALVLEDFLQVLLDHLGFLGDGALEAVEDARVVDEQLDVVEKVRIRDVLEGHCRCKEERREERGEG